MAERWTRNKLSNHNELAYLGHKPDRQRVLVANAVGGFDGGDDRKDSNNAGETRLKLIRMNSAPASRTVMAVLLVVVVRWRSCWLADRALPR